MRGRVVNDKEVEENQIEKYIMIDGNIESNRRIKQLKINKFKNLNSVLPCVNKDAPLIPLGPS